MAEPNEHVPDVDLVNRLREGDREAAVEIWTRHYPAVLAAAKRFTRQPRDAEEIASDAFTGMLAAIGSGAGPTTSVRGYLMTSVRNLATSRSQLSSATEIITDDVAILDRPIRDAPSHMSELQLVRVAFASLPRRWQVVLWRTAVDKDSNIEVGREMSLSPNGVAALARRARRGFRLAYLRAHLSDRGVAPECAPFVDGLADVAASGAEPTAEMAEHLDTCERCAERLALLRDADRNFAGLLGPAVIALFPTQLLDAAETGAGAGAGVGVLVASASEATRAALSLPPRLAARLAVGSAIGAAAIAAAVLAFAAFSGQDPAGPRAPGRIGDDVAAPLVTSEPVVGGTPRSPDRVLPARTRARQSAHRVDSLQPGSRPVPPVSVPEATPSGPTRLPRVIPTRSPDPGPTPTASATTSPTVGPSMSSASTPTPTVTTSPTPSPTSPTHTPAPPNPVVVTLTFRGPRTSPLLDVAAAMPGVRGPVQLTLEVPEGVAAVDEKGGWRSCTQSGTTISCTSSSVSAAEWSSTFSLVSWAEPLGVVSAHVRGTYPDGSPAQGFAQAPWP